MNHYFIIAMCIYVAALLITRYLFSDRRPFSCMAEPSEKNSAIHGARGLFACLVLTNHAILSETNWVTSSKSQAFGTFPVFWFFAISGLIFANRAFFSSLPVRWTSFYWRRFLRIFPMYCISIAFVVIIALSLSGWKLHDPVMGTTIIPIAKWLCVNFFGSPDINFFVQTWRINADVQWTLGYETIFYACIPLLVMLRKSLGLELAKWCLLTVSLLLIYKLGAGYISTGFLAGFVAACLCQSERLNHLAAQPASSMLIAIAFLVPLVFPDLPQPIITTCLLVSFTGLAAGNSLLGLLHLRAAQYLGSISYSFYLLHAIVLYLCAWFLPHNGWLLWLPTVILIALPATIAFASLGYKHIEQRFHPSL